MVDTNNFHTNDQISCTHKRAFIGTTDRCFGQQSGEHKPKRFSKQTTYLSPKQYTSAKYSASSIAKRLMIIGRQIDPAEWFYKIGTCGCWSCMGIYQPADWNRHHMRKSCRHLTWEYATDFRQTVGWSNLFPWRCGRRQLKCFKCAAQQNKKTCSHLRIHAFHRFC